MPRVTPLHDGVVCGFCSAPLTADGSLVPLGDLAFHVACVPRCHVCGRPLEPELEIGWSHQELVVPSANGYDRLPCQHLCSACRETTLHYEPSAQD